MPRSLRSLWLLAAVLAPAALVAACDSAPGLPPADARPSVTSFTLSPATDSLGTDAPTASVPLQLSLTLAGTGPIRVRAFVRYAGTDTLVAEAATTAEPGAVTLDVPLVLPRGAIGDYAVTVTTEGPDRRPGDGASGVFRFRASSLGPPSVVRITAAASVRRPTSTRETEDFLIEVEVSDPDARENIAVVVLEQPGVGILGALSDRGDRRGSGDRTADDGVYSATLSITSSTPPGSYTLNAIAVDRTGLQSPPFPFTFTVE